MNLKLINNSSFVMTTLPSSIANVCTGLYVNNCNGVNQIALLRACSNLTNIYCDNVGNISGPISELVRYGSCHGFDASGNPDNTTAPTINGTFTINVWYTDDQLASIQNIVINGLTIIADQNYNVSTLINNGDLVVQTLDSTKPGYNPAVGIILNNQNKGATMDMPIVQNGGKWFITRQQAGEITSVSTWFKGIVNVVDINGIVSSDTTLQYPFEHLTELTEFSNLTTIPKDAFKFCTNLKYLTIPKTVTSLVGCAYGCTGMIDLLVYSNAHAGYITEWCENTAASAVGDGTGTWLLNGSITFNAARYSKFKKIYFGSIPNMATIGIDSQNTCQEVKLRDNFYSNNTNNNNGYLIRPGSNSAIKFVSIGGTITYTSTSVTHGLFGNNCPSILHLGYDAVENAQLPCEAYRASAGVSALTKIYVGNGLSRQHDSDIFDLYNADSSWSSYCGSGVPGAGKVALWWDYNGQYRTYLVQETLTNCTNSNPAVWPYITRGESYTTTIVPDEGMTLGTVTVEMYEAVDDGTTPNTPTDITSSVYNPSTGEINIPSIKGNVIITASAS